MPNLESNLEGIFRVSGSTSMASSYTNRSGNRVSKLFRSRSAAGLSVCRWCFCWVSLLSASSHLTFFAASQTVPTGTRPPTPSLKTAEGSGGGGDRKGEAGGIHSNPRILIVLSISALFLACLFFMGFLKFLKFKIRSKSKRAVNDGGLPTTTTTHVPYPQDLSFGDISKMTTSSVKKFSWDEIESLTMNFSRVVGEGGFSTVYLAYFSDSTLGALKIHNSSERLNQVFKQELETLLHIRHDNIVKLLGYCDEREVGVLVFEYVPNGSLHEKLHNRGGGRDSVLSWKARMSIAYQLAQAIEYLHDKCTLQIVHCDIKTSNVLLDEQLNCKLCDFGFAKMGFSSTVVRSSMNPVMGSPGYMDPHYLRTGLASKKNDVYGFGVIILELITGIEAFSEKEQLLTSIADPVLRDPNKVAEMVDPQLAGHFDKEEAIAMASIAALCLRKQPILRPSIAEILRTMKEKISSVSFSTGAED